MNDWLDAESHIERAHQAFENGRWDEAEAELRRALALNPHKAEWHFNLGLTLEAAGRYADAANAFKDCHEVDQGVGGGGGGVGSAGSFSSEGGGAGGTAGAGDQPPDVALLTGTNMLRAGDLRNAILWLEKAQQADPHNIASYVHRIEAYARLAEHEQAEVMFYLAQQIDPTNALAYACLADSLLSRGMLDRAVWCLREAAHHDPSLPGVHARLAEAYARTGRLERARQLYLKELRQDPGDIDTLLDLGALLVDMNRFPEAGEKFRRVLELEPDHAESHFRLADLAERMGAPAQAIEQFGVVLRLDAEFPAARRRLAALLLDRADTGDAAAARALLTEDLAERRQKPERYYPEDLEELGRILLDARMPAEARAVLTDLVRIRPRHAQSLHLLSLACYQMGDREAGVEAGREVLRHDPRFVPAMHNMAVAAVYDRQWTRARYWVRQALKASGTGGNADSEDASLRRLRVKLAIHTLAEVGGIAVRWAMAYILRRRRRFAA